MHVIDPLQIRVTIVLLVSYLLTENVSSLVHADESVSDGLVGQRLDLLMSCTGEMSSQIDLWIKLKTRFPHFGKHDEVEQSDALQHV